MEDWLVEEAAVVIWIDRSLLLEHYKVGQDISIPALDSQAMLARDSGSICESH